MSIQLCKNFYFQLLFSCIAAKPQLHHLLFFSAIIKIQKKCMMDYMSRYTIAVTLHTYLSHWHASDFAKKLLCDLLIKIVAGHLHSDIEFPDPLLILLLNITQRCHT